MRRDAQHPTYAIIVPAGRAWLEARVRDALRKALHLAEGEQISYEWEVVGDESQYSAMRGFDAGDIAWDLAALFSADVAGKVYIAHLNEHTRGSYVYEGGNGLGEIDESPNALAKRLGLPFPE